MTTRLVPVKAIIPTSKIFTRFQDGDAELIVNWWQKEQSLVHYPVRETGGLVICALSRLQMVGEVGICTKHDKDEEAVKAYKDLQRMYPTFKHSLRSIVSLAESYNRLQKWKDVQQLYDIWLLESTSNKSMFRNDF